MPFVQWLASLVAWSWSHEHKARNCNDAATKVGSPFRPDPDTAQGPFDC